MDDQFKLLLEFLLKLGYSALGFQRAFERVIDFTLPLQPVIILTQVVVLLFINFIGNSRLGQHQLCLACNRSLLFLYWEILSVTLLTLAFCRKAPGLPKDFQ